MAVSRSGLSDDLEDISILESGNYREKSISMQSLGDQSVSTVHADDLLKSPASGGNSNTSSKNKRSNSNNSSNNKRKRTVTEGFIRHFVNSVLEDVPSVCPDHKESQSFSNKWKGKLEEDLSLLNRGLFIFLFFNFESQHV